LYANDETGSVYRPVPARDKLRAEGFVLDRFIRLPRPLEHPGSIEELRGIAKATQWKDDYRDRSDRF
jgi:hypothetical protein